MPQLIPGDVVLFCRRTLRQAGLISWLGDLFTSWGCWLFCSTAQGNYDGFWRFVHVGICIEYHGVIHLLEWMPCGMVLTPADARCAAYPGSVIVIPLTDRYRNGAFFSPDRVYAWLEAHHHYRYRWGGLPLAIAHSYLGAPAPGRFFCSEAVVDLYRWLGVIPASLPVVRHGHVAQGEVKAHAYAPCEVADLPQLARARMWEYV